MKSVDTNVNSDNHLRKNTKDDKVHSQKINLKFQNPQFKILCKIAVCDYQKWLYKVICFKFLTS